MVLTPTQANERALKSATSDFKKLEKIIDAALTEDFRRDDSCGVCIDLGISSSDPVYTLIREKYKEAGWNVTYQSDQRDGDFVRFTARRKKYG
jgi:hypothetical protein